MFVSRSGDVFFEKNHMGQKDMEDLYDMTADLAAEVKEYTTAVPSSPHPSCRLYPLMLRETRKVL